MGPDAAELPGTLHPLEEGTFVLFVCCLFVCVQQALKLRLSAHVTGVT